MIKMKKSTFVKTNKFLPLLTDTLPYEMPVLFSNRGFYTNLRTRYNEYYNNLIKSKAKGLTNVPPKTIEEFFFEDFFCGKLSEIGRKVSKIKNKGRVPYVYRILKGPQEYRNISIIHPVSQIEICDFYEKYWQEILFYTLKNDASLRHPTKRVSKVFRKYSNLINKFTKEETGDKKDFDVLEADRKIDVTSVATTYFVNKKYKILYKFYESPELLSLEQRFEKCERFDIKRCFDSIYTHSIGWATKGKEFSKKYKNKDNGFDSKIDHIMMRSNWNETNGIPIGSEFSRIFAEIILQNIDQTVESKLSNYKKGTDYVIKRYVDDYFVFFNKDDVFATIKDTYIQELMEYKLFTNSAKNASLKRPFVTNIYLAKQTLGTDIKSRLKSYHTSHNEKISKDNLFLNTNNIPFSNPGMLIKKLRQAVVDKNVSIFDISGFVFGILKKDVLKIFNILEENKNYERLHSELVINGLRKYLKEVLELSFYIFYVSTKPNNTFGLCKICFAILEIVKVMKNQELSEVIKQQIYSSFLLFFEQKSSSEDGLVDILDILWIFACLDREYKLSPERLEKILLGKNMSYFSLIMVLAYIKNDKVYENIQEQVLEKIRNKFEIEADWVERTELFMLFFDVIACPYIDATYKKSLLTTCDVRTNQEYIISEIEKRSWFFGWYENVNIKTFLEIKELNSAY